MAQALYSFVKDFQTLIGIVIAAFLGNWLFIKPNAKKAEGVKHSFSHQAWLREKRLECYVNLLTALKQYTDTCHDVATELRFFHDGCLHDVAKVQLDRLEADYELAVSKHLAAVEPVIQSLFTVNLLASPDVLSLLTPVLPSSNLTKPEDYDDEFERFTSLIHRLAKAARTDMLQRNGAS